MKEMVERVRNTIITDSGEYFVKVFQKNSSGYKPKAIISGKKVVCIETGEIYGSASEIAVKLGYNRRYICKIIVEKGGRLKGLTYKYLDNTHSI